MWDETCKAFEQSRKYAFLVYMAWDTPAGGVQIELLFTTTTTVTRAFSWTHFTVSSLCVFSKTWLFKVYTKFLWISWVSQMGIVYIQSGKEFSSCPPFSWGVLTLAFLVIQKVKNLPAKQETWLRSLGWKGPLKKGISTPVFLPREFHGQRSLMGHSPEGHKESDTTEWLTLPLFSLYLGFQGFVL